MGCAATAAHATGIPPSPTLWIGAIIASGLPDLDFAVKLLGLSQRSYHRQATHSLLTLVALVVVVVWLWRMFAGEVEINLFLAWSAALLSHPLLDAITTGPKAAVRGAGIPLFWPVLSRRWFAQRPIATIDLTASRSLHQVCKDLLRENVFLSVLAFGLVILCYVN